MRAVGLRELKNRLSEYVRMVKNGEAVLVTDRGVVVAELRPPREGKAEGRPLIETLLRRGNVTIGAANGPDLYPTQEPVATPGVAAKLLDAERAER